MRRPHTSRSNSRIALQLLVVAIVLVGLLAPVFGGVSATNTSEPELSVPGATETPTRNVTIDGTSYAVSAFAEREPGTLPVSVSTPDGTDFVVDLYTGDNEIVDFERGTGSERVEFDTSWLEPGTYVLALELDGEYVRIQPVVVSGYDVSLEHPAEVASNGELEVTVRTTATAADDSPAGVDLAIWNEETTIREPATRLDDGTYRATVSDLEPGTYDVYAVAQGESEVQGEPEILGIGDGDTLSVSESTDGDSSGTDSSAGRDPGSSDRTGADDDSSADSESDDVVLPASDPGPDPEIEDDSSDDDQSLFAVEVLAVVLLALGAGARFGRR